MPRKKTGVNPPAPSSSSPEDIVGGTKPKIPVVSADDDPRVNGDHLLKKAQQEAKASKNSKHGLPKRRHAYVGKVTHGSVRTAAANITPSSGLNFFSPQLSTDFLELPQSLREKREWFEFFYTTDPMVGQAVDLLTELPLSRVTLGVPKCADRKKAEEILAYFRAMIERLGLFQRLIEVAREYWLMGNCFIFMEDTDSEDINEYKGWNRIIILPIEQVRIESYNYGSIVEAEYLPSNEEKNVIKAAASGDDIAVRRAQRIPEHIRKAVLEGTGVPLDTDPNSGSFLYHLARAKGQKNQLGTSILERQMRTLLYRDKLRQTQTSIASRNMTPKRIVSAENLNQDQVEDLRAQVDLALEGPDYSIITNYQVEWNEIGANDRLLDLSTEWDRTTTDLCIGFGLPKEILSGEGSYSGNRIPIGIVNERFMLFRELIQNFVHEAIFKPVARRKGFVEHDQWGNEKVIIPTLKFTRMGLRDDQDTFNNMYNLYQKGSLTIDYILDLFNIDAEEVAEKLERDFGTFNDSQLSEAIRAAFGEAGRKMVDETNIVEFLADKLGLDVKPSNAESRF